MDWQKTAVDLGIAGAAIVLIFQISKMLFKYLETRGRSDTKGLDRLCTKLDNLVDSNNLVIKKMTEVMISNNKDQAQLLRLLEGQQNILSDILTKVVRIDVRTQKCLRDELEERSEENGLGHNS